MYESIGVLNCLYSSLFLLSYHMGYDLDLSSTILVRGRRHDHIGAYV